MFTWVYVVSLNFYVRFAQAVEGFVGTICTVVL